MNIRKYIASAMATCNASHMRFHFWKACRDHRARPGPVAIALLSFFCLTSSARGLAAEFAYVASYNAISAYGIVASGGTLSPASATLTTDPTPQAIAIDPAGKFAYVANNISGEISIYRIDSTSGALTAAGTPVKAGAAPQSMAIDPSGKFAYVANYGSNNVSVFSINPATGGLTAGTAMAADKGAYSIAMDPGGKFVYVANYGSNNVSMFSINPVTGALVSGTAVAADKGPHSIAIAPGGKFAYVANYMSNDISVYSIDPSSGVLTAGTAVAAGKGPSSIAIAPNGKFAYVANQGSGDVSAYSINSASGALTAIGTVTAETAPQAVAVDPAGAFVYVANYGSGSISAYSINQSTGALTAAIASIATVPGPTFVATATITPLLAQTILSIDITQSALAIGNNATVSAIDSSGLAVSFSSLTPDVCSISGGTVTGIAAGTCTIAADQPGNSRYSAAPRITKSIFVGSTGDTYDPASNQLTIPKVVVSSVLGDITYTNVVITVGSVVSVGSTALGTSDTFDGFFLTIPNVSVSGATYHNVKVTIGKVVSVGGHL